MPDNEYDNDVPENKNISPLFRHRDTYIGILQKIPVFNGITIPQFHSLLVICEHRTYSENEILCLADEESNEVFILISGQIKIAFPDGQLITTINPVGFIGEMGLFTGKPRSADVIATRESIALVITKTNLMNLFSQDPELGKTVLLNVIGDLADKLRKDNVLIEKLKDTRRSLTGILSENEL